MNLFHDHDRMKFNLTQKYDIHELFLELNEHDVCLKGKSYHLQSNEKLENAPPCYSSMKEWILCIWQTQYGRIQRCHNLGIYTNPCNVPYCKCSGIAQSLVFCVVISPSSPYLEIMEYEDCITLVRFFLLVFIYLNALGVQIVWSVFILTWYIRYILYRNLQILNHVIIVKAKVILPQTYVNLSPSDICDLISLRHMWPYLTQTYVTLAHSDICDLISLRHMWP
jgi:hypothetical protein